MATAIKPKSTSQKKSGIRKFKPGEVLFHENEPADCLYIIQKGQVRLYRPKGRGFVDLAILRQGEVIGEMAFFDEKSTRRSCSAASIMNTEVIQISFQAFAKTMEGLNPWFQTIINTLANRLRKTNERVKNLESNSVGFGAGGKVADYVFFHNSDVIKILSIIYLVVKTHADRKKDFFEIHMSKLKFYMLDVFNIMEVKYEEFMQMLINQRYVEVAKDADGLPKLIQVHDIDRFRGMVAFFNTQRMSDDSKKLIISDRCEKFLGKILDQLNLKGLDKPKGHADISAILEEFKAEKVGITDEDLSDAIKAKICDAVLVGEGNRLTSIVNYDKLKKTYPAIKIMNDIKRINDIKAKNGKGGY